MARKAKKTEASLEGSSAATEDIASEETVEETKSASDPEVNSYSPCGGVLQAERIEQGLSINEAAKQLRLSVKQIEALEQDDFSALPESTIVKGFIRNYAKLLKIPAQPLTQAYMEMAPEQEQYAFSLNPGINQKISDKKTQSYSRYYIFAVLLLIGFGVWFFYQSYIQKPSPITPTPEIAEALPELALPMAERADPPSTSIEIPNQTDVEESTEQPAQNETADEQGVDNEAGANQVAKVESSDAAQETMKLQDDDQLSSVEQTLVEEEKQEAVPPGKTRIQFTATQETWLSVVNANGNEVYNKILYSGSRDTVDVWQPKEIVVGNAHGTTLIVDGEKIDLAPYTRINVARVRLNR